MYEVEALDTSEKKYKKISDSLSRYIKYVLFGNSDTTREENQKQLYLLPIEEEIWRKYNIDLIADNTPPDLNANGIIFFSLEELARGDAPDSFLNKSRMVRSFFERTTHAKTANYQDIYTKIRELIFDTEVGQKGIPPADVLEELKKFKGLVNDIIKNTFCSMSTLDENKKNSFWKEMQRLYTYSSFHTLTSHGATRKIEEYLFREDSENYLKESLDHRFEEMLYDLAFTVAWNPRRWNEEFRFLIIDDNPDDTTKPWKDLFRLLPDNAKAFITSEKNWCRFIEDDFLLKMNSKIKLDEISRNDDFEESDGISLFENGKFNFTHVIVDLLLDNYNDGNKIIRNFLRLRHKLSKGGTYPKFDIIASSLSDEIEDIHRALQEGAIAFVPKKRSYTLPGVISRLEDSRRSLP